MTEFIPFDFTECNLSEHFEEQHYLEPFVCVCCLAKRVKFVSLKNCKHTRFLDEIFDKKDEGKTLVCYKCHKILENIEQFRLQVLESVTLLQEAHLYPNPTPKGRLKTFQCSGVEITSAVNSQPLEVEVKVERNFEAGLLDDDGFGECAPEENVEEIKIEKETCSDGEPDVPLAMIKKKKKGLKKERKKSKVKKGGKDLSVKKKRDKKARTALATLHDGKISVVTLTRARLLAERELDRQKESFLKLPYRCERCIVGFDHEVTLKEHTEKRHTEREFSYTCDICYSVLSSEGSFREHTKRHFRRYECLECGKRYNTLPAAITHYNERHLGGIEVRFECDLCGYVATSDRTYRYHRDKHKQKPRCSECGNTFVNNTALKNHMLTVHKHSSHVFACKTCNKTYAAKSGLLAHQASAHASTGKAYCASCGTHFRTEANLRHHMRTHSSHIQDQDKRFGCDQCAARFLTRRGLKEHIDWQHLHKVSHECTKCGKVFKNGVSLKKHTNYVHEKIRPPRNKICDYCGSSFTTLRILTSHIRTHTGERPLQCFHCLATFAHSAAQYTHIKLVHSGKHATTTDG